MLAGPPYCSSNARPQAIAPAPPPVSSVPSMSKTMASVPVPLRSSPVLRQVPPPRVDQLFQRFRAPRSRPVALDRRRALEQRRRDLPQPLDPVGACEERAVAEERVVDQALVRLKLVGGAERVVVAELHPRRAELECRARNLGEEARADAAGLGDLEDQLVRTAVRSVREREELDLRLLERDVITR